MTETFSTPAYAVHHDRPVALVSTTDSMRGKTKDLQRDVSALFAGIGMLRLRGAVFASAHCLFVRAGRTSATSNDTTILHAFGEKEG